MVNSVVYRTNGAWVEMVLVEENLVAAAAVVEKTEKVTVR
jgi:hypothetical protein